MVTGLYLWIYRDGRKYWRMRYWQAAKEKSLSIGVYPKVTLSDARKKREELRKQLQADLDPSAERKAANLRKKLSAENSFEAVALEWYNKQLHTWVPHHAEDVKRRLESNIFPVLGKRPIGQIEAPELLQAIRAPTESSRNYLFSGLMTCGVCGGTFTVVGGKPPDVFYGCRNHRYRLSCPARATILRDRLEQQLIAAISANLRRPELEQELTEEFTAQLKRRLELEQKLAREAELNTPKLEQERSECVKRAERLVDAIARHGISSFLSAQLERVESRLAEIDRQLTAKPATRLPTFRDEQIREFLRQQRQYFFAALADEPEFAKREIQRHSKKLVMTPETPLTGSWWKLRAMWSYSVERMYC